MTWDDIVKSDYETLKETPEVVIDGQISMTDIAEKFEKLAKAAKSMFGPLDE